MKLFHLKSLLFVCAFLFTARFLCAQTHIAVPLRDPVYYTLEQLEARGIISPLPRAKPYSGAQVIRALSEAMASDKVSRAEMQILESVKNRLAPRTENGYDLMRNSFFWSGDMKFGGRFSVDASLKLENTFSASFGNGTHVGNEFWPTLLITGDVGNSFSYNANISGGLFLQPRAVLGTYNTYGDKFNDEGNLELRDRRNALITTYSQPLTYFPYTYKKKWDGFLWYVSQVDNASQKAWPQSLSISYNTMPELAGAAFNGALTYRFARLDREWGASVSNSSLILNQTAQPFFAIEASFQPVNWLALSTLTGILEYYNGTEFTYNNQDGSTTTTGGIKESAQSQQNAFSVYTAELNISRYFHIDFGSSVIWAKRSELGYIHPLMDNFLYQNNIGDFDNMAAFANLYLQFPGIVRVWGSFFMDEMNPRSDFRTADAEMFAYQAGVQARIPWLPFASLTLSYTKIEPYCYTHTKEFLPWYGGSGGVPMEQAYTNNGVSLGSYLPPNSDELKIRAESQFTPWVSASLQYQMIRHGADYGSRAVDGSSLLSELSPNRGAGFPITQKFFLHDGAYQWLHIVKGGAVFRLHEAVRAPVTLSLEAGVVFSSFSDTVGFSPNSGEKYPYQFINTAEYPKTVTGIFNISLRVFW